MLAHGKHECLVMPMLYVSCVHPVPMIRSA